MSTEEQLRKLLAEAVEIIEGRYKSRDDGNPVVEDQIPTNQYAWLLKAKKHI